MKITKAFSIYLLLMIVFIVGCKDDFDLNADYHRQPVVYGVLDPDRSEQIIMIHHTFLGQGSAFDYALIEDSSNYENVNARIFYGNNSVLLTPTIIDDKDVDGLFFAPNQRVYTAPTSEFDFANHSDEVYRLGVMADGDTIFAETNLIQYQAADVLLPISNANPSVTTKFVTANSQVLGNPLYVDVLVKFSTIEYALKHKVSIRLHYNEHRTDGSEQEKMIEFDINKTNGVNADGGTPLSFSTSGESFYQNVASHVEVDGNVDYREFIKVEFVFYAFGEQLSRYIDIINPTTSVGQETPSYSNVNDGEGHGIFSTRGSLIREVRLSTKSLEELVHGQYTNALGFCASQEGFNCQ